jgi:hypothetical protein
MKQKRQLAALLALLVIAGGVWLWYFRKNQPVAPAETGTVAQNYRLLAVDNPHIRIEEIERARKTEYKSTGRNIFSALALPSPATHPRSGDPLLVAWNSPCGVPVGPCPPPPPEPPKLPPNIKFFGFGIVPNGTSRRAFFHDTNGDDVYVVAEGQVLLNRFRILKIGNSNVEFEELSSGRKGTAPLEEQAGPS